MIEVIEKCKTEEELDRELRDILERETHIDKQDGDEIGYEIFVDYDEEIGESSLVKISRSDDPDMTLCDILEEWRFNAEDWYYSELIGIIKEEMEDYDGYEDEIREWIDEHVYWYLPDSVTERDVDVVISLDVGDCNYDFTECNILNWYGTCGGYGDSEHPLPDNSPIRWLAEQQGKLEEVEKMLALETDEYVEKYDGSKFSKFTKTIRQELQNATSHMNTLIFLCRMPLNEYIKIRQMMDEEKELNKSYYYDERKGTKSITISKDATCGLYDIWGGGGSVLEIELEKDVEVPIKAIFDAWLDYPGCKANGRGYDVYDVYGICRSAYSGEVTIEKEVTA